MAGLVVIAGPNRGAIHTLLPDCNRLGRDLESEVQVLDDRASRFHATITHTLRGDQPSHQLRDLGSTNGTYLNGVRCEEATLVFGDELRIGDVTFLFVGERDATNISIGHSTVHLDLARDGAAPEPIALEPPPMMLGASEAILELQRQVFRVAPLESTVLITGESGTGKELVARAIHRNGPRRRGPFVALNSAALRGDVLESELFGHEKGAFTGAVARRKGAFELAAGGTLFLDEVGELPASTQAVLLRVLEGHGFRRLGGGEQVTPDVRVLAATNRDLPAAIKEGAFRQDLFYRLEVVTLALPPLREREGDVRLLAEAFLDRVTRETATPARRFSEEALAALERHAFPGNVRELKNLVERLAIFAEGEVIGAGDLPPALRASSPSVSEAPAEEFPSLRAVEREHIARALAHTGWNKSQAARLLGIDRVTLYKRIERYGLTP